MSRFLVFVMPLIFCEATLKFIIGMLADLACDWCAAEFELAGLLAFAVEASASSLLLPRKELVRNVLAVVVLILLE